MWPKIITKRNTSLINDQYGSRHAQNAIWHSDCAAQWSTQVENGKWAIGIGYRSIKNDKISHILYFGNWNLNSFLKRDGVYKTLLAVVASFQVALNYCKIASTWLPMMMLTIRCRAYSLLWHNHLHVGLKELLLLKSCQSREHSGMKLQDWNQVDSHNILISRYVATSRLQFQQSEVPVVTAQSKFWPTANN